MGVPSETTDRDRPFAAERTAAATTPTPTGDVDKAEAREQTRRAATPDPRPRGEAETKQLVIDAGGIARLDDTLSFRAQSVRVDNVSTRWLCVNRDTYIPPRMYGVIASLRIGTNKVDVRQASPAPGIIGVGAITAGQMAMVTYYEAALPEVDGEQLDAASLA